MRRVLVVCVLTCLFAATVLPASYYNGVEAQVKTTEMNNQENDNSDLSIDWWPMFHHDLCHTGFSTSSAPETNHTKWTFTTDSGGAFSSPAISNGKLYVSSCDHRIYCLDAETGELIWTYTTGNYVFSSPAIANGKVYVGSMDHKIYCLDADTGELIWTYTTGDFVWSSPAISNGKLYVGSDDDKIYCLDAETGDLIWTYTTGDDVWSSPAIANGKVYVGSYDHKIYCLDADTGELIWTYTTGDWVISSPAISNGKLYVCSDDGKIYCLDADTGELIWTYTTGDWLRTSPAISNGKLYVGSDAFDKGKIYCLDADTGELIWTYTTGDSIYFSSPAIANGKLYVGSMDHKIYCLDADTGELIWTYTTGDSIYFSSPAIANGKLYVGSDKIYCFEDNHPPLTPDIPSGPQNIMIKEIHTYTACTIDPDGDNIYYLFDWGDGTTSGWLGPYNSGEEVQVNHSWTKRGTYKVKVKAKDINGAESDWSNSLIVNVENKPPLIPGKPSGPQNVRINEAHTYTACTTDPDGDDIYYKFDWGDGTTSGWLGPYKSGEEIQVNHSWNKRGTYEVKVKAKDIYGAESGWSDPLTVTVIRKSKSFYSFWFLQWLIDHFPLLANLLKIFSSFQ